MAEKPLYWISPAPTTCDLTGEPITDEFIDGRTAHGPWACMCPAAHKEFGVGLGQGAGQLYRRQEDGRFLKVKG